MNQYPLGSPAVDNRKPCDDVCMFFNRLLVALSARHPFIDFKNRVILLLLAICVSSHCSYAANSKEFQTLYSNTPDTPLIHMPQFILIDDFNGANKNNMLGFPWKIDTHRVKAILSFDKEDARLKQRGRSAKLTVELKPGREVILKSSLLNLDVSAAHYLLFKTKLASLTPEKFSFRVCLEDLRHRTACRDFPSAMRTQKNTEWHNQVFSLNEFSGMDFNRLRAIKIIIRLDNGKIKGHLFGVPWSKAEFWVDAITFYGPRNTKYESRLDNLNGFPTSTISDQRKQELWEKAHRKAYEKVFLREVATDTWKYFENARDTNSHLVVDHIRVGDEPLIADYTSTTNIAMDLLCTVAALDLGLIDEAKAVYHLKPVFQTLRQLKRWRGFFYNFYNTTTLQVTREFISSIDSG